MWNNPTTQNTILEAVTQCTSAPNVGDTRSFDLLVKAGFHPVNAGHVFRDLPYQYKSPDQVLCRLPFTNSDEINMAFTEGDLKGACELMLRCVKGVECRTKILTLFHPLIISLPPPLVRLCTGYLFVDSLVIKL